MSLSSLRFSWSRDPGNYATFHLQVDLRSSDGITWPDWIEVLTNVSHLMTTFNSSVNFYIYFAKHWRIILGIPSSRHTEPTEVMRLRTSVVFHNNHVYPPMNSHRASTRIPNDQQSENAVEETRMLVNVIVSAPPQETNALHNWQTLVQNSQF